MSQVIAIVLVRLRLLQNRLRSRSSKSEWLFSALMLLLGLVTSLGIAALVGFLVSSVFASGRERSLRTVLLLVFWGASAAGILMPIMLSSGASGFDTSQLTIFPVKRRRLFLISWVSAFLSADHLAYYPSLLACFLALALRGGTSGPGTTLAFLLLSLIIATWSFGLLAFLQGVMKHRRSKEIAGMLGFGLILAISFLPTMIAAEHDPAERLTIPYSEEPAPSSASNIDREDPIQTDSDADFSGSDPWLQSVERLVELSPPGLAADAVLAFHQGQAAHGIPKLLALSLWFLLGFAGAYWVFRWRLRSSIGAAQTLANKSKSWIQLDATRIFPFLPVELVGVASRELRYVFRSSVGKLNVFLVPVVCSVLLITFGRSLPALSEDAPLVGLGSELSVLFGLMVYGLLFTNNFVNNAVGWEGVGFKTYLLSPVPLRRVLLGKNLGIWVYAGVLYCLILVTWCALRSVPSLEVLFQTLAFFMGSIVLFTASGNLASIAFPIPRDISAMKSQPSHPAVLCSLFTVLCLAGLMVLLFTAVLIVPWLSLSLSLTAYALAALAVYWVSLPIATRLFYAKSDRILAKLEAGI